MVQIIEENRKPSFMDRLGAGIEAAGQRGGQMIGERLASQQQMKKQQEMAQKLQKLTGMDLEGLPPEIQMEAFKQSMQAQNLPNKFKQQYEAKYGAQRKLLDDLNILGNEEEQRPSFEDEFVEPKTQKNIPIQKGKLFSDKKIAQAALINPSLAQQMRASNEEVLREKRHHEGIDLKKSQKEHEEDLQKIENARKETLPIRMEIANRATAARKGIQNKNHLIDLINTGNIDDPTYATFLGELLPYNLGKRLLSNETVEYKAGLVDEFTDLRNIFQGQTRIKEIDILEDKLADLYLTDEQKKAVLKSRINALQTDLIREEAAEEVERDYPYLGALQFSKKVDEIANKKMEPLFNKILDEHKAIIQDAENKKKMKLNAQDPEDLKIVKQLLQETGGDKQKARELAKKRGYNF